MFDLVVWWPKSLFLLQLVRAAFLNFIYLIFSKKSLNFIQQFICQDFNFSLCLLFIHEFIWMFTGFSVQLNICLDDILLDFGYIYPLKFTLNLVSFFYVLQLIYLLWNLQFFMKFSVSNNYFTQFWLKFLLWNSISICRNFSMSYN